MYVALTRAKQRLHLIVMENKNEEKVKPSRFIDEIIKLYVKDGVI
jgi:superfamily I DNA/RNA helicase